MSDITQVAEPTRKRLIELPERVWDVLDKDAKRCRRSSMKQLQVLVENVYGTAETELTNLSHVRESMGLTESFLSSMPTRLAAAVRSGRPRAQLNSFLASDGYGERASKRESRKQELDIEDVRNDARNRTKQKREPGP
jgi:hypothetical protein